MGRIILSLIFAIGAILFSPESTLAKSFDGKWKVSRTGEGCKPKGLISVKIKDNEFSGSYRGGSGKHIISGAISKTGKFKFLAKSKRDNVIFTGSIKDDAGSGRWSVKGRACGGTLKIYQ